MLRRTIVLVLSAAFGILPEPTTSRAFGADGALAPAASSGAVKDGMALESMLSTRARLHSGVCRASWRWSTSSYQEEATWTIWFDYDKGFSRIDRDVPTRSRRVKRIDTPLEMIGYVEGGGGVICRDPPGGKAFAHAEPFDIRTVGLIQLISFQHEDATWQKWVDVVRREGAPEVSEDPDGKQRLAWDWGVREVKNEGGAFYHSRRWILWIDPAQQFSPVRSEIWHGTGQTKEVRRKLVEVIEAEWTEKDGAMVPARCRWHDPTDGEEAELTFKWESINTPVPETLFRPEALGAPAGTYVVNRRLGKEFIESIIGAQPPLVASWRSNWRVWLVLANGIAIGLIAAVLIRRRRRLARPG